MSGGFCQFLWTAAALLPLSVPQPAVERVLKFKPAVISSRLLIPKWQQGCRSPRYHIPRRLQRPCQAIPCTVAKTEHGGQAQVARHRSACISMANKFARSSLALDAKQADGQPACSPRARECDAGHRPVRWSHVGHGQRLIGWVERVVFRVAADRSTGWGRRRRPPRGRRRIRSHCLVPNCGACDGRLPKSRRGLGEGL